MLTKSQAKLFFLGGTGLFAALFILLTIDSLKTIPVQTNAAAMNDSVVRGKELWDKNNCMGCHTLLGEGAYYAPELTKVYERRGPEWMKVFLKDPQAMYPGQRKMVNYKFTDKEISDLIAFFEWIGKMDLNGFPPKPSIHITSATTEVAANQTKHPEVFTNLCSSCHSLSGKGGNVGPALDGVGKKYDEAYLAKWLKDPQAVKKGTAMPALPLTDEQLQSLVVFLSSLK